jgi:ABC-type nitrate/sulfonate/bicarbonate transport system ATPase subunit
MSLASIQINGLGKRFEQNGPGAGFIALANVNIRVDPGEFVTILGPSGCGKSTLLNIISGLDADFDGDVVVEAGPSEARRRARIAYLFQEPRLLPWRTVRGNIELALSAANFPRDTWPKRCAKWINAVGLGEFAEFYPLQLSGGMQQRTAIARAFAVEPELLLMDEPFSALDELTARRMREELLVLWENNKATVVFVTHNSLEAAYLSDRILIMKPAPGGGVCDEISLSHVPRPRSYEDPSQYETQKIVLQRMMAHISTDRATIVR